MATIQTHGMNLVASKLRHIPPNPSRKLNFRGFCNPPISLLSKPNGVRVRAKGRASELKSELKEKWLDSLSCPFEAPTITNHHIHCTQEREAEAVHGKWVLGIDPDIYGAVALLKDHDGDTSASCSSHAQVFDTPHLQVLVGKRVRKRLDARSIVQLLHSFGAPPGTTAYIEQSNPFPQDGKQGWWSGGFTYGLWIGVLVSSGFSVVPVFSRLWKHQFQLSSKDDSRKAASDLFPSLSASLKRKKDHGRAEALLIAAYGKGIGLESNSSSTCIEASLPMLSLECSSLREL